MAVTKQRKAAAAAVGRRTPGAGGKIAVHFKKYYQLWLLALPGIILTLMFSYIPMTGLVIIFKDYNFTDGIFGSPWVDLKILSSFLPTSQMPGGQLRTRSY